MRKRWRVLLAALLALGTAAAPAATVYTGDKLDGLPVITRLDVADLAPGKTHRLMFQGAERGTGLYWHVPIIVAKGVRPGKRVLLVAGVHGDELNPIRAVQTLRPGLPAILLTGYAGDGAALAVGGVVDGAFSLLRKPASSLQLIDRLETLLLLRPEMLV